LFVKYSHIQALFQHPVADEQSPLAGGGHEVFFIAAVHLVALAVTKVVVMHQQSFG
jgi:hypothetical protein